MMTVVWFFCCREPALQSVDQAVDLLAGLLAGPAEVCLRGDLCGWAMAPDESTPGPDDIIISCYAPRACAALLDAAGCSGPTRIVCTAGRSSTDVLGEVFDALPDARHEHRQAARAQIDALGEPSVRAWYPVIDRARCSDCGRCVAFCIFGVYEVHAGRVHVEHPRQCKDHCPACARLCPTEAILFPKFPLPPINGHESSEASSAQTRLNDVFEQDVMEALRRRGASAAETHTVLQTLRSLSAEPPKDDTP